MKCSVKFTDTANADLRDIALYIAERSKDKQPAIRFVKALREKCMILETAPESGVLPKDRVLVSSGYRFLVHDEYLIFYYYIKEENTAYITAVFKGFSKNRNTSKFSLGLCAASRQRNAVNN